jgi:hypothetical protein
MVISSAVVACPLSPARPTLHPLAPSAAATYDWPDRREPVDRERDHPAEEQGNLVLGVGASASGFSNVTAHHVWFRNDYTSVAPSQFIAERFLDMSPRTNLMLRVQPQGQHSLRRAITRRTARTGR